MATPDEPDIRAEELAALADGSIAPERRERLLAAVEASSELTGALAEQQRAVEAIRMANAQIEAPMALRERIAAASAPAARAPRRRLGLFAAIASVMAVIVAIALVLLPSGAGGPTIAEAAAAVGQPPTGAAPAQDPGNNRLLDLGVEGVAFPDYAGRFEWRAVGTRTDRVEGQDITTVVYEKDGRRVAYGIVAGDALEVPDDAASREQDGTTLRTLTVDGSQVVTWQRQGRTCVMVTEDDVPLSELSELAAWKGRGAVQF